MSMHSPTISIIPHADPLDTAVQHAPELTVVIPTFKERDNIEPMLKRLRAVSRRLRLGSYICGR